MELVLFLRSENMLIKQYLSKSSLYIYFLILFTALNYGAMSLIVILPLFYMNVVRLITFSRHLAQTDHISNH